MPRHSYGWRKDKPDQRDFIYDPHLVDGIIKEEAVKSNPISNFISWLVSLFRPASSTPSNPCGNVNQTVDLRSQDSPIVDQGQLGSCTANALAGALAFLEKKDSLPDQAFSRLFIYFNERAIENTVSSDSGAEIRDGIKTLASQGACFETTWPYTISEFAVQPPAGAYSEAANHEILQYFSITNLCDMKACLDAGFPFVFGITVYDSFESSQVASSGVVPMPTAWETVLGGHAIMAIGYNDDTQTFICRNSWGTGWGQTGYFTIPYAYLTNSNMASDFWTIRRGTNMVKEPIPTKGGGLG